MVKFIVQYFLRRKRAANLHALLENLCNQMVRAAVGEPDGGFTRTSVNRTPNDFLEDVQALFPNNPRAEAILRSFSVFVLRDLRTRMWVQQGRFGVLLAQLSQVSAAVADASESGISPPDDANSDSFLIDGSTVNEDDDVPPTVVSPAIGLVQAQAPATSVPDPHLGSLAVLRALDELHLKQRYLRRLMHLAGLRTFLWVLLFAGALAFEVILVAAVLIMAMGQSSINRCIGLTVATSIAAVFAICTEFGLLPLLFRKKGESVEIGRWCCLAVAVVISMGLALVRGEVTSIDGSADVGLLMLNAVAAPGSALVTGYCARCALYNVQQQKRMNAALSGSLGLDAELRAEQRHHERETEARRRDAQLMQERAAANQQRVRQILAERRQFQQGQEAIRQGHLQQLEDRQGELGDRLAATVAEAQRELQQDPNLRRTLWAVAWDLAGIPDQIVVGPGMRPGNPSTGYIHINGTVGPPPAAADTTPLSANGRRPDP